MQIDIKHIPIFWLTSDKTINRHSSMERMLSILGCSNTTKISGRICTPYTIGIAETHLQAINKVDPPFLILEDDARLNLNYTGTTLFNIENIDALYLGTSTFGRVYGGSHNNTCISIVNGNYLKPVNMLGMHAILYASKKYVKHTTDILCNFIENPKGGIDDKIAETMCFFDIAALKTPMFYQDDGHSNSVTLTPLTPIF